MHQATLAYHYFMKYSVSPEKSHVQEQSYAVSTTFLFLSFF